MLDARQSNLRDLTAYAPIRVALTGIWRVLFGLLVAAPAGILIYIGPAGEPGAQRAAGDMPAWWMFLVGLGLGVFALAMITGGVARKVTAFARSCYQRAGADGVAVRLPKMGWFGRFRIVEHAFRWEEIEQMFPLTRSLNLIPVARELHIRVIGGTEVVVERFYFQASVKWILEELNRIRAQAGK